MSVAIARGNDTLVMKVWGLADVERGKLALTDSIGRYLTTGLRPEWRSLTIEQLLNHTSGMQNDLKREGPKGNDVPAPPRR
jgi:CubicO group peptidase (beta-lactamase class C family)